MQKRRALETASVPRDEKHQQTAISSADGAKIPKNLDSLASDYEKSPSTKEKTFIGEVADSLGIDTKDKSSKYATFETKNGRFVTIRLSNHNARVSNFDNRDESEGISIVVSPKKSEGMTNDGSAHVTEYYYDAICLHRADGKSLAAIVRSIKQALYSGEFEDTTGLAERQEVNADEVARYHKVYHGSGADFDRFDHSHMGEGEGNQAYGWGTYVTEVEGIGQKYASLSPQFTGLRSSELESNIRRARERVRFMQGEYREEELAKIEKWEKELASLQERMKQGGLRHLYTVEIPDDTGGNYLDWDGMLPKDVDKENLVNKVLELLSDDRDEMEMDMLRNDLSDSMDEATTGKGLYKALSLYVGDKRASELLHEAGFAGIKYPADYQRGGREDGKQNYVIFNEADAKITDHVRFFRTENGEAYGYTVGGKIYVDPKIANSETPVHEYAHLWAAALRNGNPEEWRNVVELMKGTKVWNEVKKRYPELETDDNTGKKDNVSFTVMRAGKRHRVMMRQGTDFRAGTKHSLYRHYGTGVGVIGADDILRIPEIIEKGTLTNKQRGKTALNEYEYTIDGVTYTVLTEKKKGGEIF